MRALRCDKLTLAAVSATLRLYRLEPDELARQLPTLRRLAAPLDSLRARGERLIGLLAEGTRRILRPTVEAAAAQAGSGALPAVEMPSLAVVVRPQDGDAGGWARHLRCGRPAVVGRVHAGCLLLDMRTVEDDEVTQVAQALNAVVAGA